MSGRLADRAKAAVNALGPDYTKRKWLTATVRSYGDESYTTVVHVLEGTPPRSYVIENSERGFAVALGMEGDVLGCARPDYTTNGVRWAPARRKKS